MPGFACRDQLLDHLQRWSRPVPEGNPERGAQLVERRSRADGALGKRRQIIGRDLGGAAEQFGIHPAHYLVGKVGRRAAHRVRLASGWDNPWADVLWRDPGPEPGRLGRKPEVSPAVDEPLGASLG
jgi:hypothetical protein